MKKIFSLALFPALVAAAFVFAFSSSSAPKAFAAGEFITTWKTDNPGTSLSNQITIPTSGGGGYNYNVDWGDSNMSTSLTGTVTHAYGAPGTYQIKITGAFPGMFFGYGGDRLKLLSVDQWGTVQWNSLAGAFFGCANMQILAGDAPDLSNVTDVTYAFRSTDFSADLSGWDTSHVIAWIGMFQDSAFNGDISTWDTSAATDISAMFYSDGTFDQDISGWDTSHVTNMNSLFFYDIAFDQDLSGWDVSSVTDMTDMFAGAGLSTAHYDALLDAWAGQELQPEVDFDAGDSTYCAAADARQNIIDTHGWTITDGGLGDECLPPPPPSHGSSSRKSGHHGNAAALAVQPAPAPATVPGTSPEPADSPAAVPVKFNFTRDLKKGIRGDDVKALQEFLIGQNSGPAAASLAQAGATSYFGPLTQSALAEFQQSKGISPAAGYFGPKTRTFMASF